MGHIVIISEESLFCEALSDVISRELGLEVTCMENAKPLSGMDGAQVDIVIATKPVKWDGRTLTLKAGEPRRIGQVLADIGAVLQDRPPQQLPLSDDILLNEKNKTLEHSGTGTTIDLTEKELALLLFVKAEGEASRDDILRNVWGVADGVTTHTLDTHMYRLRQKWRELSNNDCIIATDKGYRWYETDIEI